MNTRYASMPGYSLILCFDKKLELKKRVFDVLFPIMSFFLLVGI